MIGSLEKLLDEVSDKSKGLVKHKIGVVKIGSDMAKAIATLRPLMEEVKSTMKLLKSTNIATAEATKADGTTSPSFAVDLWSSLEAKTAKELDAYITKVFKQLNTKVINDEAERAIHIASRIGNLPILDSLLRHGVKTDVANVHNQTPLHLALSCHQKESADKLVDKSKAALSMLDDQGRSPLHLALLNEREDIAIKLIKKQPQTSLIITDNKGRSPLHLAIQKGQEDVAIKLIEKSQISLSIKDKKGRSFLHLALLKGRENVAIKLVQASPSSMSLADSENRLPLHYAALNCLPNAVKEVLEQSDDKNVDHRDKAGETPLTLALQSLAKDSETKEKKKMVIKLLIGHGADPTQRLSGSLPDSLPVLHDLARQGRKDALREVKIPWEGIVNMRYEQKSGTPTSQPSPGQVPFGATPLYVAATAGNLFSAKFLLEKGADPNIGLSTGSSSTEPPTPLWAALNKSRTDIAKALLKHDAKTDVEWQVSHMLHFAIEKTSAQCRTEIVKLLLSHNADLHHKDSEGRIPLIYAAEKGCIPALNALWDAHAKLELPETDATDALKAASRKGHHSCVAVLYAKGADINAQDKHGYTPLHYAARYNRIDVINVLLSMGANRTINAQTRQEPFEAAGTAEAVARASGHVKTAKMIKNWGA